MLKKTMILGSALLLSGGAVATTATMFGVETTRYNDKFVDAYITKIADQINNFPGPNTLASKLDLKDLKEKLELKLKELDEKNESHVEAFRAVIGDEVEAKLEASEAEILDSFSELPTSEGVKTLLTNSVSEIKKDFKKQFNIYNSGIVGSHDLNYYEKALSNSVDKTELGILNSALEVAKGQNNSTTNKITALREEYSGLIKGLEATLTGMNSDYTNIKDSVTSKFVNLEKELASAILSLEQQITGSSSSTLTAANAFTTSSLAPLLNELNELKTNYFLYKSNTEKFMAEHITNANKTNASIKEIETYISSATTQIADATTNIAGLQEKAERLKEQGDIHTKQIETILSTIGTLSSTTSSGLAEHIAETATTISNLTNSTTTNKADIDKFKADLLIEQNKGSENTTKILNLETVANELISKKDELTQKVNEFETKTNEFESLVNSLKNLVDDGTSANTTLEGQITAISAEIEKLKNNATNTAVILNKDNISALKDAMALFETAQTGIKDKLVELEPILSSLVTKVNDLEKQVADILLTLKDMAVTISSHNERITANANEIYASNERISTIQKGLDDGTTRIKTLEDWYKRTLPREAVVLYQNAANNEGLDRGTTFTFPIDIKERHELNIAMRYANHELSIHIALNPERIKANIGTVTSNKYAGALHNFTYGMRYEFAINYVDNTIQFTNVQYSWSGWKNANVKVHQIISER
ncbi:hypothetical protein [Mycoplasma todarodis]|uniref:Uncharacterized protein n=1 Tax=Mycoplasma todarodis TaxID=1937191 RepID=A0A4R0XJ90_9MOLU|nr:hypothetical protein [Mycoplasma todarodis]TCG10696.1 hypothetical protein C4B25_03230 [Mycoplasma todarodis]